MSVICFLVFRNIFGNFVFFFSRVIYFLVFFGMRKDWKFVEWEFCFCYNFFYLVFYKLVVRICFGDNGM